MASQRCSSLFQSNIGNSTTHEKFIGRGSYSFNSAAKRLRRAASALQVTSHVSATNSSRSPGSAPIRSTDPGQQGFAEVLGYRRPQRAVFLDAEPDQPLAPKSSLTQSVNSSSRFRENWAAAPLTLIPRTRPPASAVSRNTRNSASLARSEQSVSSMPNRKSGASCPNRSIASSYVILGSGVCTSSPRISLAKRTTKPSIIPMMSSASTKRHFQVQLGEFRLAVRPQVLVAETPGDLDVPVVAGDHQDLLVQLRRLGQRVEPARRNAAGHQVVPRPFGRAAAQDGRLDIDEVVLREIVPHRLDDSASQQQRLLHLGPAQVQVAVLQTQIFRRQVLLRGRKGRRLAAVQDFQGRDAEFDFAGVQLRIRGAFGPMGHFPLDANDIFGPQAAGLLDHLLAALGAGDDLGLAIAVAEVDEHRAAVVAGAVHPSAERYFLSNVFRPKLAASVSSQQGSESYSVRGSRKAGTTEGAL